MMTQNISTSEAIERIHLESLALRESARAARNISFKAITAQTLDDIREAVAERAELSNDIEKVRKLNEIIIKLEGAASGILVSIRPGKWQQE